MKLLLGPAVSSRAAVGKGEMNKDWKKEKIMRILWEQNFTREMQQEMVTGMVSPLYVGEYLGRELAPSEPAYLHSLVKMFTSILINRFLDKAIDMVIEAQQIIDDEETTAPAIEAAEGEQTAGQGPAQGGKG